MKITKQQIEMEITAREFVIESGRLKEGKYTPINLTLPTINDLFQLMEEYVDHKLNNLTSELKKALKEKLEYYEGHLGHPDFSSPTEQNACECLVREFKYLDSIVEYEN